MVRNACSWLDHFLFQLLNKSLPGCGAFYQLVNMSWLQPMPMVCFQCQKIKKQSFMYVRPWTIPRLSNHLVHSNTPLVLQIL